MCIRDSSLPARFRMIVDKFGGNPAAMKQAGIAYATEQIIDLIANGVRGIHVYTMNKPCLLYTPPAARAIGHTHKIGAQGGYGPHSLPDRLKIGIRLRRKDFERQGDPPAVQQFPYFHPIALPIC